MKFSIVISAFAALAASLPTEKVDEIENDGVHFDPPPYEVVDAEWDIQVFPGAEPQHFVGTIETVSEQVLALNPNFAEDFKANATLAGQPGAVVVDETGLDKRAVSGPPLCINHLQGANMGRFQEGVWYLDNLNTYINIAPRRCSRVSCSYSAGIAICNDTHTTTWALHTSLIVDYVVRISRSCGYWQDTIMAGQQFDTGGFNVIAVKMNCNAGSGWDVGIWPPRK